MAARVMVWDGSRKRNPRGRTRRRDAAAARWRPGVHRPNPNPLAFASSGPAARASRRSGLPARDLRALGAGAEGGRFLLQSRGDLLAASVAPRPRAAKPE